MKSNNKLDYAFFQLSPKRTRCELFISNNGLTEKLASGLVKPFISHLKVAEEQVKQEVRLIWLEVEKHQNAQAWFTKGTIERFVQFVNTPEVLEAVNTFDAEVSQLEAARKIYSQGTENQHSGALGEDGRGTSTRADATKRELLRAIDVRLAAVSQDLTMVCARASSAGFNPDTVSELQLFACCFGANRLNEACTKYMSMYQRRPDLLKQWKPDIDDQLVRSSWGSDMSIDEPTDDTSGSNGIRLQSLHSNRNQQEQAGHEQQSDSTRVYHRLSLSKSCSSQQLNSSISEEQQTIQEELRNNEEAKVESSSFQHSQSARRLSVQDRIHMFENKQKENSGGKPVVVGKSAELRRLSSDVSPALVAEKAVLRRWSGASDMSIDFGNEKKGSTNTESPLCTPSSSFTSQSKNNLFPGTLEDTTNQNGLNDLASSMKLEPKRGSEFAHHDELRTFSGGLMEKDDEATKKGEGKAKDHQEFWDRFRLSTQKRDLGEVRDLSIREDKVNSTCELKENYGAKEQVGIERKSRGFMKNLHGGQAQTASVMGKIKNGELLDQSVSQLKTFGSSFPANFGGDELKVNTVEQGKTARDQSANQMQSRLFNAIEPMGKQDTRSIKKEPTKVNDLEISVSKAQKHHSSAPELTGKVQGRKDDGIFNGGSSKSIFPETNASENRKEFVSIQTHPLEQAQRVRQSKVNQELNDELKMKASELEKLFAEHKLRVPGDQSSFTRRNQPNELQSKHAVSWQSRKSVATETTAVQLLDQNTMLEPMRSNSDMTMFTTPPPMKTLVDQDSDIALKHNFSELSTSGSSRGKLYENYMQKRNAKLREKWGSKRAEKEAKLKAMQDTLEQSRAELKARFSGSIERTSSQRHVERLKSFNFHSNVTTEQVFLSKAAHKFRSR